MIVDISINKRCTVSLCVDFQSYEGQIVLFILFLYYSHNICFSFQLDINYFHFIVLMLLCQSHTISNVEKCTLCDVNIFVFYFVLHNHTLVLLTTDADVISLVSLTQGAVCPNEVVQLTCSIESAAITWRIPTLGIQFDFTASDSVGSTESSGGFVGTLTVKSAGLTNSTLSFIGNSSLNGIIVECHDSGNHPVDIKNITLSFVEAGMYTIKFLHPCDMYTVCRYPK